LPNFAFSAPLTSRKQESSLAVRRSYGEYRFYGLVGDPTLGQDRAPSAPQAIWRMPAKTKPSREARMPFDIGKQDPAVISLLMDSCVNGISLADVKQPDMPLVYVNEAFERITGYRKEEILGRNCRFLQRNDRDQECLNGIREAIKNKLPFQCEIKNYKNNAQLFYNYLSLSPVFDPASGELVYYLGIQHDITRQVIAIEEIRRLNKQLEDYIRYSG
jgi:PAS domain S-box-containing protein